MRGRLLTMDEAKQRGAKADLLKRVTVLETDSRGWFEEDHELENRLNEVRCVNRLSSYATSDMCSWAYIVRTYDSRKFCLKSVWLFPDDPTIIGIYPTWVTIVDMCVGCVFTL